MDKEKTKRLGIIGAVSRHTGAFVGTATVVGNKVAGAGLKQVAAVRDLFSDSAKRAASATKGQTAPASALEPEAKGPIPLEKDLAALRRELDEAQSRAEKARSELASQIQDLQVEKQSLASQLEHARHKANKAGTKENTLKAESSAETNVAGPTEAEQKLESAIGATVAQPDEQVNLRIEEQQSWKRLLLDRIWPLITEAEVPTPAHVTEEDVQVAAFADAAERIVFTRALCDISSQDANARADAAKAMANIRHELSARALITQMVREPSGRVQQECIKTLTTLGRKEALPTIVRALTHREASVRLTAVWSLYRLAGPESAPVLTHMFSDEDQEVRRRAAICVGWLGQKELAVELLTLLADSSASVRKAAAEAMSKLRSRQVLWALIEHLNDPDKSVRRAVLGAIEAITGKKMSGLFPGNEKSLKQLMARWREWYKDEL